MNKQFDAKNWHALPGFLSTDGIREKSAPCSQNWLLCLVHA